MKKNRTKGFKNFYIQTTTVKQEKVHTYNIEPEYKQKKMAII